MNAAHRPPVKTRGMAVADWECKGSSRRTARTSRPVPHDPLFFDVRREFFLGQEEEGDTQPFQCCLDNVGRAVEWDLSLFLPGLRFLASVSCPRLTTWAMQ